MANKNTFNYETLVRYMLPQGILDSFEITKVEEEVTPERDETGTIIRILHIWLDERDMREKVWHDLKPNGFTEYRAFNDFPQREHKGTRASGSRRGGLRVAMAARAAAEMAGRGRPQRHTRQPGAYGRGDLLFCGVRGFLGMFEKSCCLDAHGIGT